MRDFASELGTARGSAQHSQIDTVSALNILQNCDQLMTPSLSVPNNVVARNNRDSVGIHLMGTLSVVAAWREVSHGREY